MCLDKLAFVGEAKDGRRLGACLAFGVGIGMRLGVFEVLIGIDAVGDSLRRLDGESAIGNFELY